jgi:hypothetical protein
MKAIIKLDDKEYECEITKDHNQLTMKTNDDDALYDILRQGNFSVKVTPVEEEIGCHCNCDTCLTPIC